MGRTVQSFRNVIAEEKQEWKTFRNALPKPQRKDFDEMWDIPRLYLMACSNSCSLVPFYPIAISILFHHYKDLMQSREKVEHLMYNNNNSEVSSHSKAQTDKINHLQYEMEQEHQMLQQLEVTLFDF